MALWSRVQMNMGHETVMAHPDFDKQWCRTLLADPEIQWSNRYDGVQKEEVTNSMFEWTLYSDSGIRSHLSFRRPCSEPGATSPMEECFLLSVGNGLDGKTGRAHGGFNSLILDHISGHCAHHSNPNPISPATASMTVDFKRPVSTPCVVLARSWLIETNGRKTWVAAVIEDEHRQVYASSKCLFISAKPGKL